MRFIYVMNRTGAEKLAELGYSLIKEDLVNQIWVFQNKNCETFSVDDEVEAAGVSFVLSDILTF